MYTRGNRFRNDGPIHHPLRDRGIFRLDGHRVGRGLRLTLGRNLGLTLGYLAFPNECEEGVCCFGGCSWYIIDQDDI